MNWTENWEHTEVEKRTANKNKNVRNNKSLEMSLQKLRLFFRAEHRVEENREKQRGKKNI